MSVLIVATKEELAELLQCTIRKAFSEYTLAAQPESQDLVPIEEAMKITNLARQTIYGMVSGNKIPFIKKPGTKKLYFSRKALLTWLQEGVQ